MMKTIHLMLAIALIPAAVYAKTSPNAKWFRYYENGVPQTSQSLTNKHIANGYEELDSGFRLIKKVAAYDHKAAEIKKTEQSAQNNKKKAKKQLIKKYNTSARATRKRTQLLSSLNTQREFAQQKIITAENELKIELDKAATNEKQGAKIPDTLKNSIEKKRAFVISAKQNLKNLTKKQYQEIDTLTQDIRKLRKIEKEMGH